MRLRRFVAARIDVHVTGSPLAGRWQSRAGARVPGARAGGTPSGSVVSGGCRWSRRDRKPEVLIGDDASPQDRLLAYTGRDPRWTWPFQLPSAPQLAGSWLARRWQDPCWRLDRWPDQATSWSAGKDWPPVGQELPGAGLDASAQVLSVVDRHGVEVESHVEAGQDRAGRPRPLCDLVGDGRPRLGLGPISPNVSG